MTKLAKAEPGKVGIGPLMTGTVAQESVSINKWNIEALSVNSKAIAPASITTDKLVVGSIDSTIIGDGSITTVKLAAAAVTADRIATNAVTSAKIEANAVTANKIEVDDLASINANLGYITAGTLDTDTVVIGAGGEGAPNTGIGMTATRIVGKVGGAVRLDINTGTGVYYMKGEIVCDKITVVSNSANNVVFGASITIGGDIILNTTSVTGKVRFDGAAGNAYLDHDTYGAYPIFGLVLANSTSAVGLVQGSGFAWSSYADFPRVTVVSGFITIGNNGASGGNTTTRGINITIGTNAGNSLALNRGATTVLYFVGNSNTVTLAGDLVINGTLTGVSSVSMSGTGTFGGVSTVNVVASGIVYGDHKTVAGNQLADGTYSYLGVWFTMADGLVVGTNFSGPT